jgi:hypothetical protein
MKIIEQLKARNIVALLDQNTNYLMANFVRDIVIDKTDLPVIGTIKTQLVWLKLYNTNFADRSIILLN